MTGDSLGAVTVDRDRRDVDGDPSTGSDASLALDDQLCFALYTASRAMTGRYRPWLDELGLSYPQYLVMLALWEHGPTTIGTLGRRLQLGTATLSPLLQRMEAEGLVRRERRPEDQRSVIVTSTAHGDALQEKAPSVRTRMCDALGMESEDRDRVVRELHAIIASLDRGGDATV